MSQTSASKRSRVARQLLQHPHRFQTQAELSRQTALDDGYVSKIVRRPEQEQLIDANADGAVRARDPNLLLDAWHNLRSTRQTELDDRFPGHVVSPWLGNCEATARKHYFRTTDAHFADAAQNPAQPALAQGRTASKPPRQTQSKGL